MWYMGNIYAPPLVFVRCLYIAAMMSLLIAIVVNVSTEILCGRCLSSLVLMGFGELQVLAMAMVCLLYVAWVFWQIWFVWSWEYEMQAQCSRYCQPIFKASHYSDQDESSVFLTAIVTMVLCSTNLKSY